MNWWKRLFARTEQNAPDEQPSDTSGQPAPWIDADSQENPFGVRLVNLMQNLQLTSFSKNESEAANAISWRPGQQDRIAIEKIGAGIPCDLRYPIGSCLPEGMLFIPEAMEDKWVIAWRDGTVVFAHSWSGETIVTADASLEGQELRLHRLYGSDETAPSGWSSVQTSMQRWAGQSVRIIVTCSLSDAKKQTSVFLSEMNSSALIRPLVGK